MPLIYLNYIFKKNKSQHNARKKDRREKTLVIETLWSNSRAAGDFQQVVQCTTQKSASTKKKKKVYTHTHTHALSESE